MAWGDYIEAGSPTQQGLLDVDEEWLRRRLDALQTQQIGAETNPAGFSPGRSWGDTARDIIPNIKRGAGAVKDLLTADIATPIDRALRFPGLDIPEDAKEETWDSGVMFRLSDGRLVHPSDLPHRAAFAPVATEQQWPHRSSLALPGLLDLIPAFTGGAAPEGALAANAIRRAGPRAARRLAPDVPEYVPGAAPYVSEAEAAAADDAKAAPRAPSTGEPLPGLISGGPLYDRALAYKASLGAKLGMTPAEYEAWLAERRGLMSEGVAQLNRPGAGERGSSSLPSLRAMSPEDAARAAASDPHLAFKRPDGNYVGAPAGVNSPETLAARRAEFDQHVARGIGGADWYQRVKDYIHELSGGDPILGRQIAEEWAVFSAQADPGSNTAFAQWARNSRFAGHPAEVARTGQQARTYNRARDAQDAYLRDELYQGRNSNPADPAQALAARYFPSMKLGDKTDVYRQHMDASARAGSTGTNDIWHGRALGYVDEKGEPWDAAFGPAQHVYMDHETMQAVNRANAMKLGGRSNWTPSEIQAAPWVFGKEEGLKKQYPNLSDAEAALRANKTYPDFAHWYTADMPHEQIPGGGTGLTIGNMTPEQWHAASRWQGPGGNDPALTEGGFLNRRQTSGMGAWQSDPKSPLEINPVDISRPQMATYTDEVTDKRTPDPRTWAGLEATAATRGLLDFQIGSPVTMWEPASRSGSGKANSITIDLGRTTTADEARALHALGQRYKLDFANRAEGAGFLNFDQAMKGGAVQKLLNQGLAAEIQQIVPGAKIGRADANSASAYADYGKKLRASNQGKGQATRQLDATLKRTGKIAQGSVDTILDSPEYAAKARMNLDRLQKSGQVGARPDYELFLRLAAEGRLRQALEWARANNYRGLPAAAGGAGLGAGLLGEANSTGPGS